MIAASGRAVLVISEPKTEIVLADQTVRKARLRSSDPDWSGGCGSLRASLGESLRESLGESLGGTGGCAMTAEG
jgi:hypothetical protein